MIGDGGQRPTDDALVVAAQAGDRRAMETLLRNHQPRMFAVCRRLTGNDADAADACQEALLGVVRGLARFDGRSAFATWAYRVAVNASYDELRRRRRRPEPGLPDEDGPLGSGSEAPVPSHADAVVAAVDIDAALLALPLDFRAAVVLRDLCGLDYEEISEVLDIPAGTVRSRISRGRASLARMLTQTGVAGNPEHAARRPRDTP